MIVECLPVGMLAANCCVVGCGESRLCAIVDPGGDAQRIIERVERLSLEPVWIIDTHAHVDHIAAQAAVKERYPAARIAIHEADAAALLDERLNLSIALGLAFTSPPADRLLHDADEIEVGALRLAVIHVPGHTPGGVALYVGKEQTDGKAPVIICGDTLFAGGIGRADLPGGDMGMLLSSIRGRLLTLPPETICYTGHGEPTTIGRERESNPFLWQG